MHSHCLDFLARKQLAVRECGDCTACCEGWLPDKSLDMSPGKPCQHCEKSGCAVYETRPKNPCRTFRCAWLDNLTEFPDDMRPDVSGVIVMEGREWRDWDVLRAAPVGAKIPSKSLEWLRVYTQQKDIPLIFYERDVEDGVFTGGRRQRAYGSREFAEAVSSHVLPSDLIAF